MADPELLDARVFRDIKTCLAASKKYSRFGVPVLGHTVDEGHDEVGEEVEGYKPDEEPVCLGTRELRLFQVHRKEDAHNAQDLGRIAWKNERSFNDDI